MSKVCFLSWHFATPQIFLNYLIKMTPGQSGKWKDMEAITDPSKADYCVIFDGYKGPFPHDRAIYVGQHPHVEGFSPSFRRFQDKMALARITLDKYLNPGEWWIDYTYDELIALEPPKKTKDLICISTYQTHNKMYARRLWFIEQFLTYIKNTVGEPKVNVDIYGRPEEKFNASPIFKNFYRGSLGENNPDGYQNKHTIGKNILINYSHSLEFDVGPTKNYLSERFYDAILLWCFPLYFGSKNVEQFLPPSVFQYIDIYKVNIDEQFEMILNVIEYDPLEGVSSTGKNILEEFRIARDKLLNEYQTWPYIYDVIHNLKKYNA